MAAAVLPATFHACLWLGVLLAAGGLACLSRREWKAASWSSVASFLMIAVNQGLGAMYSMGAFADDVPDAERARELAERIDFTMRWKRLAGGTVWVAIAVFVLAWIIPKLVDRNPTP
jgi:hypothetical protein